VCGCQHRRRDRRGHDIFGDGVNIAVPLEGVAEPGSISSSRLLPAITSGARPSAPRYASCASGSSSPVQNRPDRRRAVRVPCRRECSWAASHTGAKSLRSLSTGGSTTLSVAVKMPLMGRRRNNLDQFHRRRFVLLTRERIRRSWLTEFGGNISKWHQTVAGHLRFQTKG
jgi:hypothetical protein